MRSTTRVTVRVPFAWHWLRCMAVARGLSLSKLVEEINGTMRASRSVRNASDSVLIEPSAAEFGITADPVICRSPVCGIGATPEQRVTPFMLGPDEANLRIPDLAYKRLFDLVGSPIRGDDRASIDLAAVEQLIRLAHSLQWKMFDQHADFSCLGEADHFHELGYGAPVG